jgi:hypothetical protein
MTQILVVETEAARERVKAELEAQGVRPSWPCLASPHEGPAWLPCLLGMRMWESALQKRTFPMIC